MAYQKMSFFLLYNDDDDDDHDDDDHDENDDMECIHTNTNYACYCRWVLVVFFFVHMQIYTTILLKQIRFSRISVFFLSLSDLFYKLVFSVNINCFRQSLNLYLSRSI